jgi:hypothetical protein
VQAARRETKGPSILSLRSTGKGLWGKRARSAVAAMRDEWE